MKIKIFFFITLIFNEVAGDSVTHYRTKRNWSFNGLGNQITQQNQHRDKPPAGGYLTSQNGIQYYNFGNVGDVLWLLEANKLARKIMGRVRDNTGD